MVLNESPEPKLLGEFEELFNGQDLTGWVPRGGRCLFEARDGMIVGTCVKGSPSTYLCTERGDYDEFLFTCSMKWLVDGNSGVMFRARDRVSENGRVIVYGPK